MRTSGLHNRGTGDAGKGANSGLGLGLLANAKFEMALFVLLLLTAGAVIWQHTLLERTFHFTPSSTVHNSHLLFSDHDAGGGTTTRELGPLHWDCDLKTGNAYPYCGVELFTDATHANGRGPHGLNLANMRSIKVTLLYSGPSTSFRLHLKNYDPAYADKVDDDSPKYLRVEADTTPGQWQTREFVPSDFGVADWWLRKRKLPPELGRPQFDDITSLIIETGSEAPLGHHEFQVRDITVRAEILSDAQWYSLLLGVWIVMIVLYLGYRLGNLRRAAKERRTLHALALREAQEAACRDPLTGLLNRRGLSERFDASTRDRRGAFALAVILIDIDHFKVLNDTFGHDYGDEVLAAFAGVIAGNVRAVDIAARWGGEEFVVVCSDVDRKSAQRIAEKLRGCIAEHDFGQGGPVTASFGIHWTHEAAPELQPLVTQADKALYEAKQSGRNCCKLLRVMPKAA